MRKTLNLEKSLVSEAFGVLAYWGIREALPNNSAGLTDSSHGYDASRRLGAGSGCGVS